MARYGLRTRPPFPQPATQGSGWWLSAAAPRCALIDLAKGAVLKAATGAHRGAGHSELDLSRTLLGGLCAGDVLAGRCAVCQLLADSQNLDRRWRGCRAAAARLAAHRFSARPAPRCARPRGAMAEACTHSRLGELRSVTVPLPTHLQHCAKFRSAAKSWSRRCATLGQLPKPKSAPCTSASLAR